MKTANCIKSMVFLLAILFSFSVSAYNSINKSSSDNSNSVSGAQLRQAAEQGCVSDNVLFEEQELEDDSEDFLTSSFLVLPFLFSNLNFGSTERPVLFSAPVPGTTQPLFISIRVLRI